MCDIAWCATTRGHADATGVRTACCVCACAVTCGMLYLTHVDLLMLWVGNPHGITDPIGRGSLAETRDRPRAIASLRRRTQYCTVLPYAVYREPRREKRTRNRREMNQKYPQKKRAHTHTRDTWSGRRRRAHAQSQSRVCVSQYSELTHRPDSPRIKYRTHT